jgi:chromate transporter
VKAAMSGMRIIIISMIGSAALLLMFPTSSDGRSFIDHWSWIIFGVTIYASYKKVNPILLIVLSAIVGIVIYI